MMATRSPAEIDKIERRYEIKGERDRGREGGGRGRRGGGCGGGGACIIAAAVAATGETSHRGWGPAVRGGG